MPKKRRTAADDASKIHHAVAQQQRQNGHAATPLRQSGAQPGVHYVETAPDPLRQSGVQYVQTAAPAMAVNDPLRQSGVQYVQTGVPPTAAAPPPMAASGVLPGQMVQDAATGQVYLAQSTGPAAAPAASQPVTTATTTQVVEKVYESGRPIQVRIDEAVESHMMFANIVLAGFVMVAFQMDVYATERTEASALSLQLVAFGCFLSSACFYALHSKYRRAVHNAKYVAVWVYCAHLLSVLGIILLIAAVAVVTKVQLGKLYRTEWMASVTVMIVLVLLPILCDAAVGCSRAAGEAIDRSIPSRKRRGR